MFEDPRLIPPDPRSPAGPDSGDKQPLVIPPGPCEGCRWCAACAGQSLACRVFLHFVSKGTVIDGRRRPNRGTYCRVFGPPPGHGSEPGGSSATVDWIDDLPAPRADLRADL